jgi:hypothetical protein
MPEDLGFRKKLYALYLIASYRPRFTGATVGFGVLTALLEGIGVTLIVPLIEVAQSPASPPDGGIAVGRRNGRLARFPTTVREDPSVGGPRPLGLPMLLAIGT